MDPATNATVVLDGLDREMRGGNQSLIPENQIAEVKTKLRAVLSEPADAFEVGSIGGTAARKARRERQRKARRLLAEAERIEAQS
jgi:hypothetical protein